MPHDLVLYYSQGACSLAFHSGTVHVGFAQLWRPERFANDKAAHAAIMAAGRERLAGWFDEIDAAAAQGWMIGDRFSLADLLPFVFRRWARRIGTDMVGSPGLGAARAPAARARRGWPRACPRGVGDE